jgi:hypothetical protein
VTQSSKERYQLERDRRFQALKGRTLYRRNLALAAIPGAALGLLVLGVTHSLAGLVVAAVGAAAGPFVYRWRLMRQASDEAQREVMNAWAAEHGWLYEDEPEIPDDVAFCRNRQKPRAEHGFRGPMAGMAGRIFNFTYSTYETRTRTVSDGQGGTRVETYQEEVKHRHTVLRLGLGELGIGRLSLTPQGFGGGFAERLRSMFSSDRSVQLESSEFNDQFCLLVDEQTDELAVRRVFEPALIVRLVEGRFPLATFQYELGALAFVWSDQYDVEELEEVEHRVSDAAPIAQALASARDRVAPELRRGG